MKGFSEHTGPTNGQQAQHLKAVIDIGDERAVWVVVQLKSLILNVVSREE